MEIQNKFIIKEGLMNSPYFAIENGDMLTIDRLMTLSPITKFFECVVVGDVTHNSVTFLCDQIAYDPIRNIINFLNTKSLKGDQVSGCRELKKNEIASVYAIDINKILIVINREN